MIKGIIRGLYLLSATVYLIILLAFIGYWGYDMYELCESYIPNATPIECIESIDWGELVEDL